MIPFLGAGANLADRGDEAWEPGSPFLPSGAELAEHLVERGRYPLADDHDLLRVSQYVDAARGEDELYVFLREVFDVGVPADLAAPAARARRAAPRTRRACRSSCSRRRTTTT